MALLKACVFGAITGPVIGFVLGWLLQTGGQPLGVDPFAWLARAASGGVVYAVAFYFLCGLPIGYVRWRLAEPAPRIAKIAILTTTAFLGSSLASLVVFEILRPRYLNPGLVKFAAIAGISGTFLALVGSAFDRLRLENAVAIARSESKALQAQINPHFFFNTLNTISSLIPVDPDAAQRTLGLFADMSRYAFAGMQSDLISLERELEFANQYVQIEKIRFGDRLRVEWPAESTLAEILVPPLTVQPLIENAIRHGIAKTIKGGTVAVRVRRNGTQFSLAVENDVESAARLSERDFFRPGHALHNIRERLSLAYRKQASVDVAFSDSNTVVVTIQAPIHP